ncbi:hypothetical protein HHUSO_G19013 [Huso huso]|uniref:HECT domain-containing protein n=1 Tax=Huso huso TaxID=61971 RepID=A0ABR0Z4W9_HUSHU
MPLRVHWYKFNCLMIGSGPAVNHLCHGCRLENDLSPISHLNLMSPESVIAELCSSVLADGVQNVKVRQNHAFQDLLRWMNRADYGWDKHLNVSFVGEQGLDSGGPRRNLMELTVRGLINWGGLWCGKGHLIPAPDFLTLQNRSHCMAGRIVGTVLVQSSLQLNIFAESLINTIAGINQWFVEDVADETVQSKLKEILDYRGRRDWTGDPVVEKIAENISFLGEVNDAQKKDFTQAAARYYTSVVNRAQIEEFKEGLETFGIASPMLTITDVMKLLLCGQKRATIQPDEVYDMFEAELSEVGSNQRDLEEEAMMHFMLFLSSLTNLSKHNFYYSAFPFFIFTCFNLY